MNKLILLFSSGLALSSLAACKWTEFDDLRDEAWAKAITKRDGSKASNWGVGLVRAGVGGADGGSLVVLGTLQARVDQVNLAANGDAKFETNDLDLGNLAAIDALAAEPIVIEDPLSTDYSAVTVSSNGAVVVVEGSGLTLQQNVINKTSGALDGAAYMVPPARNSTNVRGSGRTAAASQVVIASDMRVFGAFTDPRIDAFDQVLCDTTAVTGSMRAIGAVRRDPANTTDDVAVWTDTGDIVLLDGHVFNGAQSFDTALGETAVCPGAGPSEGILDPVKGVIGTAVPTDTTPFIPGDGTLAQILTFGGGRFAILQGHDAQNGFLRMWDFGTDDTATTAGAPVGLAISKPGLKYATLIEFDQDGDSDLDTFVAIGVPGEVVDGVSTGQVEIYRVDPVQGIISPAVDRLSDAQPEDGQAFGRAIAALDFNGQPVLAIAANNEVFVYYRTPTLYNDDRRQ